jgi:hypothetical protein
MIEAFLYRIYVYIEIIIFHYTMQSTEAQTFR